MAAQLECSALVLTGRSGSIDREPVLFTLYPHNPIRNTYLNFTLFIPTVILISYLPVGVRVKVYHKTEGDPVDYRGLPPSLQLNAETVAQVRPRPLSSTALQNHK